MERRTSCLQSNVDFLMKTITKLSGDHQRRVDAANRQIDGLKATVASLEKLVEEQKKAIEDVKKASAPPARIQGCCAGREKGCCTGGERRREIAAALHATRYCSITSRSGS